MLPMDHHYFWKFERNKSHDIVSQIMRAGAISIYKFGIQFFKSKSSKNRDLIPPLATHTKTFPTYAGCPDCIFEIKLIEHRKKIGEHFLILV
jgi:hypothetical protein